MQVSHDFVAASAVFDDEHLVSCAGLVPVMTLATQTGLSDLLAEKVRIAEPRIKSGSTNPSPKLTTVIAGMCVGADSIDDLDVVRSGGMASWKLEPFANPTHDGLFYFGIFRDDRVKDFDKYLECGEYTVNVSARSSKALLKFTDRYYISGVTGVLDFPEFKQFKLSLYLEDSRTHTQYHSLANRFFECLGLGIAQVFDSGCTNTLRMAGIYDDAKPWIVDSPNDIARLLPKWRSIRTAQRELWVKDYRAELVRSVRKMFRSEGLIDLLT